MCVVEYTILGAFRLVEADDESTRANACLYGRLLNEVCRTVGT